MATIFDFGVYIAGGWFSPEQEKTLDELEGFVKEHFELYFSPREHNNAEGQDLEDIFQKNIWALDEAEIIIASTVGKDMGTLWECGYAYARELQVIYYAPGIEKVNLMLAKSGRVARNLQELEQILTDVANTANVGYLADKDIE